MSKLFDGLTVLPSGLSEVELTFRQPHDAQAVQAWVKSQDGIDAKKRFKELHASANEMFAMLEDAEGLTPKRGAVIDGVPVRVKGVVYCPGDPAYSNVVSSSVGLEVIPSIPLAMREPLEISKKGNSLNHQDVVDALFDGGYRKAVAFMFVCLTPFNTFWWLMLALAAFAFWLGGIAQAKYGEWYASLDLPLPTGIELKLKEFKDVDDGNYGWPLAMLMRVSLAVHLLNIGADLGFPIWVSGLVCVAFGLCYLYLLWNGIRKAKVFEAHWDKNEASDRASQFDSIASLVDDAKDWKSFGAMMVLASRLNIPLKELTFEAVVAGAIS